MGDTFPKAKVAVVQAAPVLFEREATVAKAADLTAKASANGAQLVLFPEAFIPAYPRGLGFGTVVGNRSQLGRLTWERYWANSVEIPSPTTDKLSEVARKNNVYLVMGIIERDRDLSGGTLYCTIVYYGPEGEYLGKHRKLMPTGSERLIWGAGDGSTLTVIDTEFGKVGGLICWENYMPLVRVAMYGKGVQIYLAPTADQRERWQSTLQHIALEGRCFVLGCNQYVTKSMYPKDLPGIEDLDSLPENICEGGSAIYSPLGEVIAGPLYGEEGILYAELDLAEIVQSHYDFDAVGHYSRPDILQLIVRETPQQTVVYEKMEKSELEASPGGQKKRFEEAKE